MATNIVYKPGQHLPAPVASGTTSGSPVRLGSLNGVTITDRAANLSTPLLSTGEKNPGYNDGGGNAEGNASVWFEGVVKMSVTAGSAPAFGDPIYYKTADGTLSRTSGDGPIWGHSVDLSPVDNGGGTYTVLVRITN